MTSEQIWSESPHDDADEITVEKRKAQSQQSRLRHVLPACLLFRSKGCQHSRSCLENVFIDAVYIFTKGMGLVMALKHLPLIANPAKLLKSL